MAVYLKAIGFSLEIARIAFSKLIASAKNKGRPIIVGDIADGIFFQIKIAMAAEDVSVGRDQKLGRAAKAFSPLA